MNRKELINKLISADEEATMISSSSYTINVVLVGGSVLMIKGLMFRQTPDIDMVGITRGLDSIFNKYDMNYRANAFSDTLPYNYEDRLEKLELPTKTIQYYMLSLEDLIIMKLHSGRDKDWKDITNKEVIKAINWEVLDSIIKNGELDYQSNERIISDFKYRYQKYLMEYKKI